MALVTLVLFHFNARQTHSMGGLAGKKNACQQYVLCARRNPCHSK